MDFINKLIKKGIFGLILVFGFFVFGAELKVNAATGCSISLNDGDKYLVLSQTSKWNDSGVEANCGQKVNDITVTVNNTKIADTTDSAEGAINRYVEAPGFYTIEYSITGKEKVYGETFITRQIRVLPSNLNSVRNLWLGEANKVNSDKDDEFVKIVNISDGYLVLGNIDTIGYVVKYDFKGEYKWAWKTSDYSELENVKVKLTDIVESLVNPSKTYYISGSITEGTSTTGFVKLLDVTSATGVTNYGSVFKFDSELTSVNKLVIANNYIVGVGHLTDDQDVDAARMVRVLIDTDTQDLISSYNYFPNKENLISDSRYNSVIHSNSNKIIAVGYEAVSSSKGAIGGSITVCDENFSCETLDPQLYQDQGLGNTTITRFNDIIEHNNSYLIVGESRANKVAGTNTSYNSGLEDALIILGTLDGTEFAIEDAKLVGSSSADSLYSIRAVDTNTYLSVGKISSSGSYITIKVDGDSFETQQNLISGNSVVELKDVFVRKVDGETQYVFVGTTKSNTVEGMLAFNKGLNDAVLVVYDVTAFDNYSDINVLKDSSLCNSGATDCSGNDVLEEYWLKYGNEKYPFLANVSTSQIDVIYTNHEFVNSQGIKFKIGRKINVVVAPVPSDIELPEVGIDKWYWYSRKQDVGGNSANISRVPTWNEVTGYYEPVKDGLPKSVNEYYLFDYDEFVLDDSEGVTQDNYKKLPAEPQANNVAFQSIEKARAYARLQEFTRIGLVTTQFNPDSGLGSAFAGENDSLKNKNYYFIYYIDSKFGDGTCQTRNLQLEGDCSAYKGYAFASLTRLIEIMDLVLEKNNNFVSEIANTRYDVNGNVTLPSTSEFKEEMSTIQYVQQKTISIQSGLYLDVKFYGIDKTNPNKYAFNETPNYTDKVSDVASVSFSEDGYFKEEGKYVVKYCYNAQQPTCGKEATFVIDRTAPIINYDILDGDDEIDVIDGSIDKTWRKEEGDLFKMIGDAKIVSIADIDPYAYTLVDGKKYYLQCNETVNSSLCISDYKKFVRQNYTYAEEPGKIFNINVYDRAGNQIYVDFSVATAKPTVNIEPSESNDTFVLEIDFYNKNKIDSLSVIYTASETCEEFCADAEEIKSKILDLIEAYNFMNYLEMLEYEKDNTYVMNLTTSFSITFTRAIKETDTTFVGGALFPEVVWDIDLGGKVVNEEKTVALPLSKGKYEFSITDVFFLNSKASGGIGLEKAKVYVYENDDEWYEESEATVENGLIPKIDENITHIDGDGIFKAKVPDTYGEYLDLISNEALKGNVDKSMFFTEKFIYLKFKENAYGITEINLADSVNPFGNPEDNYNCLFTIYGANINSKSLNQDCTKQISLITDSDNPNYDANSSIASSAVKDMLKEYGIYIVAIETTVENGTFYYLAFTKEGIYNVYSKVDVKAIGMASGSLAIDINYTFAIDKTAPTVTAVVDNTTCKGELSSFSNSDFLFTSTDTNKRIINIGNCDMKIDLTTEKHNGVVNTKVNRLLLLRINDETFNAYDYSMNVHKVETGNYLLFNESGTYEITFMDAALNEATYKFIIDKEKPQIGDFVDINPNKDITQYQQYVDVKVTITEDSFLFNNTGEAMLTVYYTIDDILPMKSVVVQNVDGACEVVLGDVSDGKCQVSQDGKMTVSFVITINKTDRLSIIRELDVIAVDYFGNQSSKNQPFNFDNNQPYIYFSSEYTPITDFGENVDNDERKKMLSVDSNDSLGNFTCTNWVTTISGQNIYCRDTPEQIGKNNNVVVEAYEAYRIANNNFSKDEYGNYNSVPDGKYMEPRIVAYTAVYKKIETLQELNDRKTQKIYEKQLYTLLGASDLIDPNKTYYYGESKTPVTISNMYKDYSSYQTCGNTTGDACALYKMYMASGKFTSTNFYEKDDNHYVEVTSIVDELYDSYYYVTNYEEDVDYSDNYLPAIVLENSYVQYKTGDFLAAPAGRIKVLSDDVSYYNKIHMATATTENPDDSPNIIPMQGGVYAVPDTRIWQIAVDGGVEVKFGFVYTSTLGRPIIFRAKDGAGNYSSNYLETVIIVKDKIPPKINSVLSAKYEKDETNGVTSHNYVKTTKYYKVAKPTDITCDAIDTTYYVKETENEVYSEVTCGSWQEGSSTQYYAAVEVYEKVADGLTKETGTTYYKLSTTEIKDNNYLTKDNLVVTFSEPIYRVTCTYYNNITGETKLCSFSNTEFDYIEEKTTFQLNYEGQDTYLNYTITVYDFSENATVINYFYIDRDKPTITFDNNSSVKEEDIIEVDYSDAINKTTAYNEYYLREGYKTEVTVTDSIDDSISKLGVGTYIKNTKKVNVSYYKFDYTKTYNNYKLDEYGNMVSVPNYEVKNSDTTYYILIKKPAAPKHEDDTQGYILNGIYGTCDGDDEYCYIEDNYNYYPSLLNNNAYWIDVTTSGINREQIGVYKVIYTVTDYSGNVGEELVRTVYVVDTQTPTLLINDETSSAKSGYHKEVTLKFSQEGQGMYYEYTCDNQSLNCSLPTQMFAPSEGDLELLPLYDTIERSYKDPGLFKVYFHDLGKYVDSEVKYIVCDEEDNCETHTEKVKTLKYNYRYYQFVIDNAPPVLSVNAYKDDDNKLYYMAQLTKEEYLYCVKGNIGDDLQFSQELKPCSDLLSGTHSVSDQDGDGKTLIYTRTNNEGKIVSKTIYEKLAVNEKKRFFNTYYKKQGSEFFAYKLNESYIEDNVYMITLIELYFRDDGRYLIKSVDKAGNEAGRRTSTTYYEDTTLFDIDNTAPTYNKNNNMPIGANYWFSVPKEVITYSNIENIKNIPSTGNSYYYLDSNPELNNSFFYAFATYTEAYSYLSMIYRQDIESKNSTCNNNQGFKYSYYDKDDKDIIEGCFTNTSGGSNKETAKTQIDKHIRSLIYPTFSGETLFGDQSIKQVVCDSSISSNCTENKDMYKYVYLRIEGDQRSIEETCVEYTLNGVSVQCIKINVKIVKYNTGDNKFELELNGANTKDTVLINKYSKPIGGSTTKTEYTADVEFSLDANTYYIFEEMDNTITFFNYLNNETFEVSHYNTSYYAIYVDNTSYVEVYYEDDYGESENELTEGKVTTTVKTNSENYWLILKGENAIDFIREYEIYESKIVRIFKVIGTYNSSESTVIINGVTYTINGTKVFDSKNEDIGTYNQENNSIEIGNDTYIIEGDKILQYVDVYEKGKFIEAIDGNVKVEYLIDEGKESVFGIVGTYNSTKSTVTINGVTYTISGKDERKDVLDKENNKVGEYYITRETDKLTVNLTVNELNYEIDGTNVLEKGIYNKSNGNITINGRQYITKTEITEVYSYLRMKIDGTYVNINEYIVKNGNNYYFRIPMQSEHRSDVEFIDRAGTVNALKVSRSKKAPTINVKYEGEGKDQTVTLELRDNELTKVQKSEGKVKIEFSQDGKTNYIDLTDAIKPSLFCAPDTQNLEYGCINQAPANLKNEYKVKISSIHGLYGFFKVSLIDDHGNSISLEFVYNPADMEASYIDSFGIKYITESFIAENETVRMISKEGLQIKWNNKLNYLILYKEDGDNLVEVCNTKNMGTNNGKCDAGEYNRVTMYTKENNDYDYSVLTYVNEGIYKAKIINRQSIVIHDRCYDENGEFSEDCNEIKTSSNVNACSNEPTSQNYCNKAYNIIEKVVKNTYVQSEYTRYVIDQTAPVLNVDDKYTYVDGNGNTVEKPRFLVKLPAGVTSFTNNGVYKNAIITINYNQEPLLKMIWKEIINNEITATNEIGFTGDINKQFKEFKASSIQQAITYKFYLVDYAGNESQEFTFTIETVLPEIRLFQIDDDGNQISETPIKNNQKINTNVVLYCYIDDKLVDCTSRDSQYHYYSVTLYEYLESTASYRIISNSATKVEPARNTMKKYKFEVAINFNEGNNNFNTSSDLKSSIEFIIDKQAPIINLSQESEINIFKGSVTVTVPNDSIVPQKVNGQWYIAGVNTEIEVEDGVEYFIGENGNWWIGTQDTKVKAGIYGILYKNCNVDTDNTYTCNETPIRFKGSYTLTETGAYKVEAVDEVGNTTLEDEIKHFKIDNDNPLISVKAQTTYLEYQLAENGYTNAQSILIQALDNNANSYIQYRYKTGSGEYPETWTSMNTNSLIIVEEGMYEVKVVDCVGNVSITRHFIIYRQKPKFDILVNGRVDNSNTIIVNDASLTWKEPKYETEAPIVKVTMNGRLYERKTTIKETGEYTFVLTDLAGNITTHKITINKEENICLNGADITPKKQFLFPGDAISLNGDSGYTFKEDDVLVLALPTNYYSGGSGCGNLLKYQSIDDEAYLVLTKALADYINQTKSPNGVPLIIDQHYIDKINELGGFVYVMVVEKDVAKNDLGFKIGENFFTKDPLGWTLIFATGIGMIYVGLKLFVLKKKVKVLK